MADDVLVTVDGLSKKFCRSLKKSLWYGMVDMSREIVPFGRDDSGSGRPLRADEFWAVNGVSFELRRGECLGLIGRNGAGKTTLLKMLNGLIKPDRGRIEMRGRVGALIALGAGFNPILTGRENIFVNGAILGLSKRELDGKVEEIIDFADIREFIDAPVQSYSSGMQVRLGFAIATAMQPDILLLDEVLAVGDAAFRAKCFQRIGAVARNAAIIFVSHDHSQVARICDSGLVLERGTPLFLGSTAEALARQTASALAGQSEQVNVLAPGITEFIARVDRRSGSFQSGDALTMSIEAVAAHELAIGLGFVNVIDHGGNPSGQIDLTGRLLRLQAGRSVTTVTTGPLRLAAGRYSLNIALFGVSKRETVAHSTHFDAIDIEGPPFLWCAYKVPVAAVSAVGRAAEHHAGRDVPQEAFDA